MSSREAQLKKEVAETQKSLAELASSQSEMDKMRAEEKAAYAKNKPEMEQGLEGIKAALQVLRDYYASPDKAHAAAEGAGTSIVSLLEVCESDFSKGLAEMVATEESAAATYDQQTKDNAIEKASKEKDVTYKSKEIARLGKTLTEASSDRSGVQTELDAVVEYLKKLDDMCIAKPDTYAERKRRRDSELAGLKEALEILDGEAVLLQQRARRTLTVRQPIVTGMTAGQASSVNAADANFAVSADTDEPAKPPGYRNAWDDCGGVGASATERMRTLAAKIKGWAKPLPFVRHAAQDCGTVDAAGTKAGPGASIVYPGPETLESARAGLEKAADTLEKYPAVTEAPAADVSYLYND